MLAADLSVQPSALWSNDRVVTIQSSRSRFAARRDSGVRRHIKAIEMLRKAWTDPVWSKVIATGIIGVAGLSATFFLGWWPSISSWLSVAGDFLGTPIQVPRWAVLLMALLALPAVVAFLAILWTKTRPPSATQPPGWTSYRSDLFLGLRWRWTYNDGQMSEPLSFCPICDYQIHAQRGFDYGSYSVTEFHCDSCAKTIASFKESYSELSSKAARLAQMKIRNGSWVSQVGA